jgi:hypothetical protein
MEKKVNEMMAEINRLKGEIFAIENNLTNENTPILVEEILNLFQGVGTGYIEGDYYAPDRVYSRIEGVKNIRFDDKGVILVKVTSPKGYLLPSSVVIEGREFKIIFAESENYSDEVDY